MRMQKSARPVALGARALEDALERERLALMRIEAILGCLNVAMEHEGSTCDRAPYYPIVVEMTREMVTGCIAGLGSIQLDPMPRASLRARRKLTRGGLRSYAKAGCAKRRDS